MIASTNFGKLKDWLKGLGLLYRSLDARLWGISSLPSDKQAGVQDFLEEHRLCLLEQQRREIERQRARERCERQVERRKQEKARLECLDSEAIRWADAVLGGPEPEAPGYHYW